MNSNTDKSESGGDYPDKMALKAMKIDAFDKAPYAILISDGEGRFIACNPETAKLPGYEENDLLTMRIPDVLHPEDIDKGSAHFLQVKNTGFAYDEYRYKTRSNETGWWSVAATKISDNAYVAYCLDVSDRKQIEQKVTEYQALMSKSEEVGNTGSWRLRHADNRLFWSDQTYRIFGLERNDKPVYLAGLFALIYAEDREYAEASFARSVQMAEDSYQHELRIVHRPTGEIRYLMIQCVHLKDSKGKIVESVGNVRDKTLEIKSEEALKNFKFLSDFSLNGVLVCDLKQKILYVNKYYAGLHGLEVDQMQDKQLTELRCYRHSSQLRRLFETVTKQGYVEQIEIMHLHENGEEFPALMNAILLADWHGSGPSIAFTAIDMRAYHKVMRDYKGLFDQMQDGFALHEIICDENGTPCDYRFLSINPAFERLTGLRAENVVGHTVLEILPDTEPEWIRTYGKVALTGEAVSFENFSSALDKYYKVTAFRPEHGQFAVFFLDVTETKLIEKQLKETGQYLENLINYANAPIIVWDNDFRITRFNQAFELLTGINATDAIGAQLDMLFPTQNREATMAFIKASTHADERWNTVEIPIQHRDGSVRTVLWNSANIYGADGKQLVSTIAQGHDITDRIIYERELVVAKERAEESNRLKTHFMNNISHEIRTPLNGILGFSDLLAMDDATPAERQEYLRVLKASSNRLLQTITDIMDISELKAGTMKPQLSSVNIGNVLKEAMQNLKESHHNLDIAYLVEFPEGLDNVEVLTDEELLFKIMNHLLGNAGKFTKTGQIATGFRLSDDAIEIYVRDTGRGVHPDKQKQIFEPFIQEDISNTRGFEGSGLGLSIVKGLLDLLGGSIRLDSAVGTGSTFYFTLPNNSRQQEGIQKTDAKPGGETGSKAKKRILLAEDDEANAQVIGLWLKKAGFEVDYAFNGKEAIEQVVLHPDTALILMDIKMPKMNGSQAMAEIRLLRPDIPVVAITAYAMTSDKDRFLKEGFNDYLAKPFSSKELLEKVFAGVTNV
ncbi:MAG TPA: PAS domain S-box protein [Bacteroidales bacterium]|nr:PAS domain S-box protein [Bacteroidales bacterium]